MESKEYQNIKYTMERTFGRRPIDIDEIKVLKKNGMLNYYFKKNVKPELVVILKDFLKIMNDKELEKFPYYRKVCLYKNDFMKCFKDYGYELCTWFNKDEDITPGNNISFFLFPLFFQEACRKCGLANKYNYMSFKDLTIKLNDYIDLIQIRRENPRRDRHVLETEIDVALHGKSDLSELNILGEEISYNALKQGNMNVSRVTKDSGKGYGFDLLSLEDDKEVLVNVKAGDKDHFFMTRVEQRVMYECASKQSSEYYIHRYVFDKNKKVKEFRILKYDKDTNTLLDVNDNTRYSVDARAPKGISKVQFVCAPIKEPVLKKVLKK